MEIRKVTAIIRTDVLEEVEAKLQELRVPGITVTRVRGYGAYANLFRPDWLVTHARIEIFMERERAYAVARAIVDTAHRGIPGDGIVVVLPVETVLRIRSKSEATLDELSRSSADLSPAWQ